MDTEIKVREVQAAPWSPGHEQIRPHGFEGSLDQTGRCQWCGEAATGLVALQRGRIEYDDQGRRMLVREIRAEACSECDRTLERRRSKADAEARGRVRAREWRARQTATFDSRTYAVGGHESGWWE